MVLAFTEEQKKKIEEMGMTVVQAKLGLNRFAKAIKPVFDQVRDICRNMSRGHIEEFSKADEEES